MKQVSYTPVNRQSLTLTLAGALAVTIFATSANAQVIPLQPRAGEPLPGLTPEQLDRFFKGKDAFMHQFTATEGLGPAFNQTGCSACHIFPVVGGSGGIAVTRFGVWDASFTEFDPLDEFGGSLFQMGAITEECADEIPDPAWFPDGNFVEAFRITNSSLGLGLVESVEDSILLANEGTVPDSIAHMVHSFEDFDPNDENFVPDTRVGRMGWKAQVATVLTFSADASRNELGLSNRFIPHAPPPKGDTALLAWCENLDGTDNVGGAVNNMALHPNDQPNAVFNTGGVEFIDRITDFQRFASPPPQTPRSGTTGEQIFMDIGCGQCHVPSFTTSNDPEIEEALRGKTFKPYSDFLLQNIGLLGDLIVQGDGGPLHIRTPNLWGVRDRDPLLHDGRVGGGTLWSRIAEPNGVIHWHNQFSSQAAPSAQAFNNLATHDKELVVNFLDSLGRREFDYNGDNFVDFFDFLDFIECFTGPDQSYLPANWAAANYGDSAYLANINEMDHPCAVFDVNQDGRVDVHDFKGFLRMYDDFEHNCDLWSMLESNVAHDIPVPPACDELCGFDLNGDSFVSGFDLVELLSAWGPCSDPENCPADFNGDGLVNGMDLVDLLAAWGPCPVPETNSESEFVEPTFIFAISGETSVDQPETETPTRLPTRLPARLLNPGDVQTPGQHSPDQSLRSRNQTSGTQPQQPRQSDAGQRAVDRP